ncbi:CpsD/CapB family tyrosine-protein kinase [Cellvibrio mixtus]|uniref:CpsD/CapB family tyrosine-protein kinase n=1 Tax=Cellvibrio mixtus TaxID=39650 RepID=UPI0006948DA2|nr:CpsD/CapB family tyrosine-protein kinase [Cellvibrio mixtus]
MNDFAQALNPPQLPSKIGSMLVARGKLDDKDLPRIAIAQKKYGLRFGAAALKLGLVSPEDISAVIAEQFAYTPPPTSNSPLARELHCLFAPDSARSEAVRSLRSELMLRYFNSRPGAGLTLLGAENPKMLALTAANLAISFAQIGLKTLLIDGNLRKPGMDQLFAHNSHRPGLTDGLAGRGSLVASSVAEVDGLWFISAGTPVPNPQELLANRTSQQRLFELQNSFDITLINTAPMDTNRDAQLQAAQTGTALLVAQRHQSKTKALASICARMNSLNVRLLGVALYE